MSIAVWVLLSIETLFAVGGLVGAFTSKGGDAAGRGMAQGYAAIAMVLAVLLLVPALLLQTHGHSLSALLLCIVYLLPVLVLVVAG